MTELPCKDERIEFREASDELAYWSGKSPTDRPPTQAVGSVEVKPVVAVSPEQEWQQKEHEVHKARARARYQKALLDLMECMQPDRPKNSG